MNVFVLKLNAVQVLALSCLGVALGIWLKSRIRILDRLNIPAPIVGGLIFALLALFLRDRYLNLEPDLVLRDILMVAFFTTIGMSASLRLLRVGGPQVVLFFGLATLGVAAQNIVGVACAMALGLNPLMGVIAGSVTMAGGPATALAFGPTFESIGVSGATTVGVAAAMFGIVAGGLLGGFTGGRIITKRNLKPAGGDKASALAKSAEAIAYAGDEPEGNQVIPISDESEAERSPLLSNVIVIAIAMGIGTVISGWIQSKGFTLPTYVGAMIAAAILRNLDDRFHFAGISQHQVDMIGSAALNIFLVMALLTLRLWELAQLAAPLLAILAAQVGLVWLMAKVTFWAMGRDYESAVMSAGYCGFMLGTSANALAAMGVLTEKYGPAPRAFIVVPLVGAFLIDFTNALLITGSADLIRSVFGQ